MCLTFIFFQGNHIKHQMFFSSRGWDYLTSLGRNNGNWGKYWISPAFHRWQNSFNNVKVSSEIDIQHIIDLFKWIIHKISRDGNTMATDKHIYSTNLGYGLFDRVKISHIGRESPNLFTCQCSILDEANAQQIFKIFNMKAENIKFWMLSHHRANSFSHSFLCFLKSRKTFSFVLYTEEKHLNYFK